MRQLTTTARIYPAQNPPLMGTPPAGPAGPSQPAALQQVRTSDNWGRQSYTPLAEPRYIYMAAGAAVSMTVGGAPFFFIECPAMSATFYLVFDVQDMNKGEATEQRRCACIPWSFPTPLP